jgi:hypothetical protein
MFHPRYYFVATVIHIKSLSTRLCYICALVPHNIETLVGPKNLRKQITAVNAECQGNLSECSFGHLSHRFANPAVGCESAETVRFSYIQICVQVEVSFAGAFQ